MDSRGQQTTAGVLETAKRGVHRGAPSAVAVQALLGMVLLASSVTALPEKRALKQPVLGARGMHANRVSGTAQLDARNMPVLVLRGGAPAANPPPPPPPPPPPRGQVVRAERRHRFGPRRRGGLAHQQQEEQVTVRWHPDMCVCACRHVCASVARMHARKHASRAHTHIHTHKHTHTVAAAALHGRGVCAGIHLPRASAQEYILATLTVI